MNSHTALALNLRLLCSYVGSVTECSRKIGINRQQLSKYLNGNSQPSLPVLRKICDYFGVDNDEIVLPPEQFKQLLTRQERRSPAPSLFGDSAQSQQHMQQIDGLLRESSDGLEPYLGDYHYYYFTPSYEGYISRGFARLKRHNGMVFSHFYERVEASHAMMTRHDICKFVGVVFLLGDRLQIVDYHANAHQSITQTTLYGTLKGNVELLSGLTSGVQGRSSRIPFSSRIVFEKLSSSLPLKEKLKAATLIKEESPELLPAIRDRLLSSSHLSSPHILTAKEHF